MFFKYFSADEGEKASVNYIGHLTFNVTQTLSEWMYQDVLTLTYSILDDILPRIRKLIDFPDHVLLDVYEELDPR